MGLDMFLWRATRYRNCTMDDVDAVESWLDWKRYLKEHTEKEYTFREWCGRENEPKPNVIAFYGPLERDVYSEWDTKHEHPWKYIREEVGYWRKANAIHKWFVDHVQDGEDDCEYHREVTEEDLEELLTVCKEVLASITLVNDDDGLVVEDSSVAEELLPCTDGFFFGSTHYDEWYVEDLKSTILICEKILAETDFDSQMVYYRSSW